MTALAENRAMRRLTTLALCALLAPPAAAHHSGAAFDKNLPVKVSGTVAEVQWASPHARLLVAATDDAGAKVTWDFELPSPVTLMRRGWSRNSLKVGDAVSVTGIRARDFQNIAIAQGVTDASGKRLFSGTASAAD
jgi:Family of unknown function (DUF6152)